VDALPAAAPAAAGAAGRIVRAAAVGRDALVSTAVLSGWAAHAGRAGAFTDPAVALLPGWAANDAVGATLGIVDAFVATAAAPAAGATPLAVRAAGGLRNALVATALLTARAVGVGVAERLADAAAVATLPIRTALDVAGAALGIVDAGCSAAAAAAAGATPLAVRAADGLRDALVAAALVAAGAVVIRVAERLAEAAVATFAVRASGGAARTALGIVDTGSAAAPPAAGAARVAVGAAQVAGDALVSTTLLPGWATGPTVDAALVRSTSAPPQHFCPAAQQLPLQHWRGAGHWVPGPPSWLRV
jgi:hypothetical protein